MTPLVLASINREKGKPKPELSDFMLLGEGKKPKPKKQSANYMKQALRAFAMMHNRSFKTNGT